MAALALVLTVVLIIRVPKGFIPTEDTGRIGVTLEAAQDASFEAMTRYVQAASPIIAKNPYVAGFNASVGGGFGSSANSARFNLALIDRNLRPTATEIAQQIRRDLAGIHFAMEYLPQQNKASLGQAVAGQIHAKDKHVVILGGGDTGADCLGTAIRQGCKSVKQFELLPKPPDSRAGAGVAPWPYWPMIYRTSAAHEEAEQLLDPRTRDFSINT